MNHMARNTRIAEAAAVAASALLCLLCVPPYDLWPFALVSWSPFVVVVARAPWRRAAALGLLHGTLVNVGALYWIYPSLYAQAGLAAWQAAPLFLLLVVIQASRSVLAAVLTAAGTHRGWPLLLVFPLALASAELVCPVPFPWQTALFTHAFPEWMQLADVGGPLLLTAWLGFSAAGFALGFTRRREGLGPVLRASAPSLATVALVTAFGAWKLADVDAWTTRGERARIGVVQGNVRAAGERRSDPAEVYRTLSLELLAREPHLDLLVWPETAVEYATASARLPDLFRNVLLRDRRKGPLGERIDVPLVTGTVVTHGERGEPKTRTNSAVLADANGRVLGVYDKQMLVPLGERSLPSFVPYANELRAVNEFVAGEASGPLELGGRRIGASICYEDILHRSFLESARAAKPELFVNLTSDRWFTGTPGPKLHLAMAKLRAVEHRKYLLRATTSGVSALVGPSGRVEWTLPEGVAASGAVAVHWLDRPTPYQRAGDVPWLLAAVLSLALSLVRRPLPIAAADTTECARAA